MNNYNENQREGNSLSPEEREMEDLLRGFKPEPPGEILAERLRNAVEASALERQQTAQSRQPRRRHTPRHRRPLAWALAVGCPIAAALLLAWLYFAYPYGASPDLQHSDNAIVSQPARSGNSAGDPVIGRDTQLAQGDRERMQGDGNSIASATQTATAEALVADLTEGESGHAVLNASGRPAPVTPNLLGSRFLAPEGMELKRTEQRFTYSQEGGVLYTDKNVPVRRYSYHFIDTMVWENPKDGSQMKMSVPREEVIYVPITTI